MRDDLTLIKLETFYAACELRVLHFLGKNKFIVCACAYCCRGACFVVRICRHGNAEAVKCLIESVNQNQLQQCLNCKVEDWGKRV